MRRSQILILVSVAIASVPVSAQPSRDAQVREMDMTALADQPGYVPNPSEEQLDVAFQRQPVFFRTTEQPGTLVVHTSTRFAYLVQGGNRAIRYGIGVGRDGFRWTGVHRISRKAEWPDWTPPPK